MPRKVEQGSLLTWRGQNDPNNREAAPPSARRSRPIASLGSHSRTAANLNETILSDEALIGYGIDDSIDVDDSDAERHLAPEDYNASDEAGDDIEMTDPRTRSSSPVSSDIGDDVLVGEDIDSLFDFVCYRPRRMFGTLANIA
jgi:hypothetical protein